MWKSLYVLPRDRCYIPFAAFIPFIVQAVSGIANYIGQRRAAKKEAQYNLNTQNTLNQQAFSQNKEMWQLQNQYNTPAAQMGRFQDAGLSPNLIYQQGSSGNASQVPNIQPAQSNRKFPSFQIPDMIGMYQNYQTKQAGVDRMRMQTELMSQKVRSEAVERMNKLLHGERGRFDLELAKELRKYNVDIKGSEAHSSSLKAKILAKEFALLDQFGTAERKSRLKTAALSQARTAIGTQSEQERLALLKQFGWTKGYQESAAMDSKILSGQQQAVYDKLKTTLFRDHQMTPSDNFLVRMLMHFMMDNGMTPEDFNSSDMPPR